MRCDRTPNGPSAPRPCVVVRYAEHPHAAAILRAVRAGLEEEGVPCRVERAAADHACRLSHDAARASALDVGIGLDQEGSLALHHAKFAAGTPVLTAGPRAARALGHNAARLVTGLPFKPADREEGR